MDTLVQLRDPALEEKQWNEIRTFLYDQGLDEPFHDLKDTKYNLLYIEENNLMEFKDHFQVINYLIN